MTCSATHRQKLRIAVASYMREQAEKDQPFDFPQYIKDFYNKASKALKDDELALIFLF